MIIHLIRQSLFVCLLVGLAESTVGWSLDLNGDGMSDIWQAKYGVGANDGNSDPDGDGFTNAQEALFGTDPMDANDFPRVAVVSKGYNANTSRYEVTLTWQSIEGVFYLVEESHDMTVTPWAPVVLPPSGVALGQTVGGVGLFTSVTFPVYPSARQFYRIKASASSMPVNFTTDVLNFEVRVWGSDPATTDSDGDTIPDLYEITHGLNPFFNDANLIGASGITNLQAYLLSIGVQTQNPSTDPPDSFLFNTAAFSYNGVSDSYSPYIPHYTFGGGIYLYDSFNPTTLAVGTTQGNQFIVTPYQTEIFGETSRLYDTKYIEDQMAAYGAAFEHSTASDESRRWTAFGPLGGTTSVRWVQGTYPDADGELLPTDAFLTKTITYITGRLGSACSEACTMSYNFIIQDDQIAEDETVALDASGNPVPPMIYTGTVRFRFPAGGKYPSAAEIPVNQLPNGILSIVNVAYPHSLQAAKIVLAPPGPNTRRSLIDVQIVQSPAADRSSPPEVTAGVRFCRWRDAFQVGGLDPTFADFDPDLFQVSIAGAIPGLTKVHIKSTDLNGAMIDGSWNAAKTTDGNYDVDVRPEFGGQASIPLLLVSDGDDDKYYNGLLKDAAGHTTIATDDGHNDQTLLGDFGSRIVVTLPEFNNQQFTFYAQRPVGKVMIKPFFLSASGGDPTAEQLEIINNQLHKAQEIYRQIGVFVDISASLEKMQIDASLLAANGIEPENHLNSAECETVHNLMIEATGANPLKVCVGYIDATLNPAPPGLAGGFTYAGEQVCVASITKARGSDAFKTFNITAHELGHALNLKHEMDFSRTYRLMTGGVVHWNNRETDAKRFTADEINTIKTKSYWYVPLH